MKPTPLSPGGWRPWLLAAPALALLLGFFVVPLALLFRVSLYEGPRGRGFYRPGTWTLDGYAVLVREPYFREILTFTVLLGLGVTLLTLLLAYPLALFLRALPPRARTLAVTAVVLPKLAGALVTLFGLELVLGNSGPVNGALGLLGVTRAPISMTHNLTGVVLGETYLLIPYAVLILTTALEGIDPELTRAARGLGATPWRAFCRVTLPLSLPGVALAGQVCLIWALGAQLGPLLLGGPQEKTLAVEVQHQAFDNGHWPRAAAVAVFMLLTLAVCLALYRTPARLARKGAGR